MPDSCCKTNSENCGDGLAVKPQAEVEGTIFTTGCLQKLEQEVVENIVAVGGAGVGIAFLQVSWAAEGGGRELKSGREGEVRVRS